MIFNIADQFRMMDKAVKLEKEGRVFEALCVRLGDKEDERKNLNMEFMQNLFMGDCNGCGEDHYPEDCKRTFERDYDLEAKDAEVMADNF